MTREEEIDKEWVKFAVQSNHRYDEKTFKEAVEWADENPDVKRIYTKKQLMDMGFAFTTNGDIVTPDLLNEHLKKYLKYQKQKFIEKGKEWLRKNIYKHVDDAKLTMTFRHTDEAIENFEKLMKE